MTGRLTIFESRACLAKRWELIDGKPVKSTAAQMTSGTYRVASFGSAAELAELLSGITTHQAVCASLPRDGSESGRIVTRAELPNNPGAKARTKEHFGLPSAPGPLYLDHDGGGFTRDDLWQLLLSVCPALAGAGVVWRPSGSSHIFHGDSDLTGLRGQHLYVMLKDASDGPRVIKVIADRLWLAGRGEIAVSKAGSLLVRCPIDTAPSDAARLIFAGGAAAVAPLEQRRGPAVILANGGCLDSVRDVPDLSAAEQDRVAALIEQAKAAKMPEAMQRRAEHRHAEVARRLPEFMKAGVSAADAEIRIGAAVDAAYCGVLLSDFMLTAVHEDGQHETVSVAQVLVDRDRWHEANCLEPINPGHRNGAADARLYLHGTSPIVYSLDDGGKVYRLRTQQTRLTVQKGARGELVQQLASIVAGLDCVFLTDTGPVLVDGGKRWPLTVDRLLNVIGAEVVLTTRGKTGDLPTDLPRDVAALVLAALPHTGEVTA